ncbi:Eco57I restriction-modification methylase domain-containing protein [Chryseosolibacter indicus]|uniref:site-specific DNA-methyltransferase (adenine-specific) n=1 Tax=Chryseosolibacter indicus TaxID=2782351 RepID=A0ABS5W0R6_9BACT|nr:TaqI-like C-terminal specificity domain-containing protein [Chryseosolibacter indicus]MBT1705871.1 N-6 DNA methylase [Chryseosolibacter indicus]
MERKQAKTYISEVLQSNFDTDRFQLFLKNLLNDFEPRDNSYHGSLLWEAYRDHINHYRRIGKYIDPHGEALDILIVETKSLAKLDRARTSLRNFVVKHLQSFEKDYALVAFYSNEDQGSDWRFSFVKIDIEAEQTQSGKVKSRKELTPAKRFSYLVGKHENSYTAQKQLISLLENDYSNPLIADIENAFSIEKVTDEFFEQYKELYLKLFENLSGEESVTKILTRSHFDVARFTKKLLGQIVFLYFLQKKGWLGVPKDETWGKGEKRFLQKLFIEASTENKNFFNAYLQFLFYEALAKPRSNSPDPTFYKKFDCKIPFLNGGLFEADYDWVNSNLILPNELFRNSEKNKAGDIGTGILDVFDRYNFTIKEDEPLDKEVAVDPEMLGKVFENMLEITERKSKGAYYTPREVVHYMCQESLIQYLHNSLCENNPIQIPREHIETFITKGHLTLENDLVVQIKGRETRTQKFQLPETVRENAKLIDKKLTDIKICDPAIGSGAFPVGLLHELVTAQKVLLPHLDHQYLEDKLKVIGLEFDTYLKDPGKYIYRIKRHAIQESIYGVDIDASAIDIARLRLWLSLIVDEDDFYTIEALPNLDYKIVNGNSLIGMPEESLRDLKTENELEGLKDEFFDETDEIKKRELRGNINSKIRDLLASAKQYAGYNIDFDFKLFFSEVWHYKKGFDVVIGNPPYVFGGSKKITEEQKKAFKVLYSSGTKKINLFALYIEKGLLILKDKGSLNYITPNTLLRVTSYSGIREYIVKRSTIEEIADLDVGVFKNVTASTVIIRLSKQPAATGNTIEVKKGIGENVFQHIDQKEFNAKGFVFDIFSKNTDRVILSQLFKGSVQLKNITRMIRFGVVISGNLETVVSTTRKSTNWKPFLEGDEITSYRINYRGRFLHYSKELLHRSRTPDVFEVPKIMVQRITGGSRPIKAVFDSSNYYNKESIINIILNSDLFRYKYVLAILNSELINWFYAKKFTNFSKLTVNLSKEYLEEIPIKNANDQTQKLVCTLVDYVTYANSKLVLHFFLNLIDAVVFELYLMDVVKSAKKQVIPYLSDLKPLEEEQSEEQKVRIIQDEFDRLYNPNHQVRNNLESIESIDEVRTIKENLR